MLATRRYDIYNLIIKNNNWLVDVLIEFKNAYLSEQFADIKHCKERRVPKITFIR